MISAQLGSIAELTLDERLKYWVLIPISVVMVLAGVIRQRIMSLIGPGVNGTAVVKLTESAYIAKGQSLIGNGFSLSHESFNMRREYLAKVLGEGTYVAKTNAENESAGPTNPFSDPGVSEGMMNMAKGNMANFIPQTLIMWWVNHFFAGFVLMKLPFPLTVPFKEMLQAGIMTRDLDVRWVSSISWYFISVLGLNPVYSLLLTDAENTDTLQQQQDQLPPVGGPGQPQAEAIMKTLSNDLMIAQHQSCFTDIEKRVLQKYAQ